MKFLLFYCCLLSGSITHVTAYDKRGAAERILYYYSYLAEEAIRELDVEEAYPYSIAVGCIGNIRPNGRCTFNEFCKYIWAERLDVTPPDNIKPDIVDVLPLGKDVTDYPVSELIPKVENWKARLPDGSMSPHGVTGNSDSGKVFQGATDFYDALRKSGGPIGEAGRLLADASFKDWPNSKFKRWEKIVKNGFETSQALSDLRWQDVSRERNARIQKIFKKLCPGAVLKKRPGRRTNGAVTGWEQIDADATIKAANRPEAKSSLAWAIGMWEAGPAMDHWAAISAADQAEMACGCLVT